MSLYLFITRKPNPLEAAGTDIAEIEWRSLALSQTDFRMPRPQDLVDNNYPGAPTQRDFIWTGHPDHPTIWFEWSEGQVQVKNADAGTIVRMNALAEQLNARVVSETGEKFNAAGAPAGFEPYSEFYQPPKRSLLDRLFGRKDGA